MAAGLGAVFGKNGGPSLRDLYAQSQEDIRYNKRLAIQQAENKREDQVKNTYFLNKVLDPSKYGTGNPQGPEISHYIISKRDEYQKALKETGLSTAELMGMINEDMMSVQQYLQNSKMFDVAAKKISSEMQKKGFKASEIDRELRKRVFFKKNESGEYTPKQFSELDWDIEGALNDLKQNGVDDLTIDESVVTKPLQARPLTGVSGESYRSTTPNSGQITKVREKGTAMYDPQFDRLDVDESGVVKGIFKKSMPYLNNDGTPYVNKETGQPADEVITTENFEAVYNDDDEGMKAYIDKRVNKRVKALREKGVDVTEKDIDFLRKDEVTEVVYNNTKTRFASHNGLTTSWRRAERPRSSGSDGFKSGEGIDFSIAPRTADGGFRVMGQTGEVNLGKNLSTGRSIKSDDVVVYGDGSVKVYYSERDQFGNVVGEQKITNLSSAEAAAFLKGNRNLEGNKNTTKRIAEAAKSAPGGSGPKKNPVGVAVGAGKEGSVNPNKPADEKTKEPVKPKPKEKKFKGTKNKMY